LGSDDKAAPDGGSPARTVSVAFRAARIASRDSAVDYVRSLGSEYEGSLLALYMDRDFSLLAVDRMGEGSLADCGIKPLLLVRRGLELGAASFILVHYAPRRTSSASLEEAGLLRKIRRGAEDFDVYLLDYLILGSEGVVR
jgi:DNA repair protein RadC